jgi:hypothetical protein
LFAGIFPRLAVFILWVARPERVDAAFSTFPWPLLGIIFLPFATLIYLLLYTPGSGTERLGLVLGRAGCDPRHWTLGRRRHPAEPDPGPACLGGVSAIWHGLRCNAHLRIITPPELTATVLQDRADDPGVTRITADRGAATSLPATWCPEMSSGRR